MNKLRPVLALCAALSVSACGGVSNVTPTPQPGNVTGVNPSNSSGITSRIVGVGDSLTAGVQSDALLGADVNPNPIAGSPFPFVPNTQSKGYYARIWEQANPGKSVLNPSVSPLPLIAAPGLGQIIIPTATGGVTSLQTACGGNNALAFSYSTAAQTRINPGVSPLDVAIPGQTMHEALYMYQPLGPCNGASLPSPFNGLNQVVGSESLYITPILSSFGRGSTQIGAATRLSPTLAIVWLGSNDLLHYLGSNGGFPPPTVASFQADAVNIISQLQKAGAKVAIANLLPVEDIPYFTPVAELPQIFVAKLGPLGVTPAEAEALAAETQAFLQSQYGLGTGSYLTLTGANKVFGAVQAYLTANPPGSLPLDTALTAAKIGAGDYVSANVAATGAQLNAAYSQAIAAAAHQRGAALVDVASTYNQILANGGVYPIPTNPACCSVQYGGGLFSLDGVHPSDTGYAIISNVFIETIDQAYGANIPPLTQAQIEAINATDLYSPH
jgi:lysophospholipase L1-like esterase